jgi:hypothetical protein
MKPRRLLGLSVLVMLIVTAIAPALVLGAFHGVAVGKTTVSPVNVGDPYTSSAVIRNIVDTAHDTVRVTGLSDAIASAGGTVQTANILGSTGLVFNDPALVSRTGGSGAGTSADPHVGATECLVKFGGTITTKQFSHYTVLAADFNLPNHRLTDQITWNWNNTCVVNPDNDCTTTPQIAKAGASALVVPTTENCPVAPAAFGLGAAGTYTVLGLQGAKLVISEGNTSITGDVGLAANGTGNLLKATINGKLFLDPTAHPDIHAKDLKVTGGIVVKNMSPENSDAFAANTALAAMAPTQAPLGPITTSTTITGGAGTNVISLAGVNLVKGTLTLSGSPNSLFIINVTGGFNFSSSQMVLAGGVQPNNVIWNFIGAGPDVNIFKPGTVAYGTFLAPFRNIIQDHATLSGRYIGASGGLSLKMHSAATVICP